MKRVVSILVVLIIAMSSFVFAASVPSDILNTRYEEPAMNLMNLEILEENSGGTFLPDKTVTKAEMAKILVNMRGLEPLVSQRKKDTDYDDVKANHWACGYVNVIQEYGIYKDTDLDGNFYPDRNLTYAEAVTYCVRLLGYGTVTDSNGTWPANYKARALNMKLLDDVDYSDYQSEVTRGELSILLWNTLNTNIWEVTSSSSSGTSYSGNRTLLEVQFPKAKLYYRTCKIETKVDGNEGGNILLSKETAISGDIINVEFVPEDGYELDSLEVYIDNSKNRNYVLKNVKDNKIDIICTGKDIKIEASFYKPKTQMPEEEIVPSVSKKVFNIAPEMDNTTFEYNGKEQEIKFDNFDNSLMNITGNKATEVGHYTAKISVKNPEQYAVSYHGTSGDSVEIGWGIITAWISLPTAKKVEYTYNGKEQTLELSNFNESLLKISGNSATDVGEYEAIISIKDINKCRWNGGETGDYRIKWSIVTSKESESSSAEKENEVKTYKARITQTTGGTIKADDIEVEEGENQTFTITPESGYRIVDVKVDGKSVGEVTSYTIENVKKAHKITATFEKIVEENSFDDVKENDWYYQSINYVTEKGLFRGVSSNEFAPNMTMNRAMLVTVLYRLAGEKKIKGTSIFSDIEKDAYYENSVIWAYKNNIVSGVSETEFAPNNLITREQLIVMLYRYAKLNGMKTSTKNDLSSYDDMDEISSYAIEATTWGVENGLISGRTNTTLAPKETATRAEVATILMRYSKLF